MTNFEFVFSLFGLLLGLALAEVLAGLGNSLQSRRKVRVGWLTPLLGLLIALDLTTFWMVAWSMRDNIPIHYFSLLCGLVVIGLYYLIAHMTFPNDLEQWPDLDDYYFAHRKLVLGGALLCNAIVVAAQAALEIPVFPTALSLWGTIAFVVGIGAASFTRGRRASIGALASLVALYPLLAVLQLMLE